MAPKGNIDGLEGCYVVGWAHSKEGDACLVEFMDRMDSSSQSVEASRLRPDPVRKLGPGNYAFRISLGEIREAKSIIRWCEGANYLNRQFQSAQGASTAGSR